MFSPLPRQIRSIDDAAALGESVATCWNSRLDPTPRPATEAMTPFIDAERDAECASPPATLLEDQIPAPLTLTVQSPHL